MEKFILAIDTATYFGSVALQNFNDNDDNSFVEWCGRVKATHSETLVSVIGDLIKTSSISWKEIGYVAVGIGPGSFTGLRIGLATAKGICFSNNIPLIGVSTLAVRAMNAGFCCNSVCVVMDAKKGELYWGIYRLDFDGLKIIEKDSIDSIENFIEKANRWNTEDIYFLGDGIRRYKDNIKNNIKILPQHYDFPHASNVALLAKEKIQNNDFLALDDTQPLYLRELTYKKLEQQKIDN